MIREAIAKVVTREDLSEQESEMVMREIMEGEATPSQMGSFLTALRLKGETIDEIAGCARAMRAHSIKVKSNRSPLVDTCGTGGDGVGTFNISTIAAFVVDGAGLPVAKHGNRAVSSKCGSADLLDALSVRIDITPEQMGRCIDEVGIGFLFAQSLHPAMKHAAPTRKEMGIRTIFNILGPLSNPASAPIQLLGVYDPKLTEVMCEVLNRLGSHRVLVVNGADGLDELSTTGVNKVTCLRNGEQRTFYFDPAQMGIVVPDMEQLKGGCIEENVQIAKDVLQGKPGPQRDIVLLNAAAALAIAGHVSDIKEGFHAAARAIDSGQAAEKLESLVRLTNSF
ncbi:MAG: anthranilate phosphoribosyltransferase [Chloroflexota bacterium]|nr:anthranilate phosphoribosyltransferase [Chloroflexota bacterium]